MNVARYLPAVLAALVLTGCGGDAETEPAPDQAPVADARLPTVGDAATSTAAPAGAEPAPEAPAAAALELPAGEFRVVDLSERSYQGRNALAITLNSRLDPAVDYQRFFRVSRKEGGAAEGAWILAANGSVLYFPYTDPATEYEVTVARGLRDAAGNRLEEAFAGGVKTRAVAPAVSFDTNGVYLPARLSGGLPVVAINVDAVDIDFHRIKPKHHFEFLNATRGRNNSPWQFDRLSDFGELVHTGRYDLDLEDNTRTDLSIPVDDNLALSEPGIYFAVMRRAGRYQRGASSMYFMVTDLGVHVRQHGQKLDVYVSSLESARPVAAVTLQVLDTKNLALDEVDTGQDGYARLDAGASKAQMLVARKGTHMTVLPLRGAALDLSEFDVGEREHRELEPFVYGARDLYRPGETVDFNLLLRDGDGRLVSEPTLSAELAQPDGSIIKTFSWRPRNGGYYGGEFELPPTARTGRWTLMVALPGQSQHRYEFSVEEFLPERIAVEFESHHDAGRLNADETLRVIARSAYLYGAPAAGNRLQAQALVRPARTPVEAWPEFEFGDATDSPDGQSYELPDRFLDDAGETVLEVDSLWKQTKSPLSVALRASVFEAGGRAVTRVHDSLVWPGDALFGIRPGYAADYAPARDNAEFEVILSSADGELRAAKDVEVTLVREDRQYFWEFREGSGWHSSFTEKEFPVWSGSLDLGVAGPARVQVPVEWGRYRLVVRAAGRKLLSSLRFEAGYGWYRAWEQANRNEARPDRVNLAWDKGAYSPGDVARLHITPPAAGSALVAIESDRLLWSRRLDVAATGTTVEIPIDRNWKRHDIYATALVLRPADAAAFETPKRALGVLHLPLDREDRRLAVEFELPEKAEPEQPFMAKIQVRDATGKAPAGATFITLAAVDVGVLSVSNFATPDPFEAFFGQRRHRTESRDIYGRLIELSDRRPLQQRFGGDADLSRGGAAPPTDVQIISLIEGPLEVDADGNAEVELEVPDFNGRVRLMAVAWSRNAFGSSAAELTIAAPLVTQLALPRFLANGDRTRAVLDLHNLSGKSQTLAVSMTARGPVSVSAPPQDLLLADGEKRAIEVGLIAADSFGPGTISLRVDGSGLTRPIERDWALGVRPAYPASSTVVREILSRGEALTLGPEPVGELLPDTLVGRLRVSTSPELDLDLHLRGLLQYPYGCLEQTTSMAYPLVLADRPVQEALGMTPLADAERGRRIESGVARLATMQMHHGGFTTWPGTTYENQWLSVYATDFLQRAADAGYAVPAPMLAKARKRLQQYLQIGGDFIGSYYSVDTSAYAFSTKAYAAYVLAKAGEARLGQLRSLADREQSDKVAVPWLHLSLALQELGDRRRAEASFLRALAAQREATAYYGDYGSPVRDNALLVHLLRESDFNDKEALTRAHELAAQLKQRRYFSTQERTALLLAGMALQGADTQDWSGTLELGDLASTVEREGLWQRDFDAAALREGLRLELEDGADVYATFELHGYSRATPAPVANGFSITRDYYTQSGEPVKPEDVRVGQLYLVHLEVRADQRTPDALVVDLQPAGFEIENQNLEHAIDMGQIKIHGQVLTDLIRPAQLRYEEFRDDRYVVALDLQRARSEHLFYLVRAVTPGDYQVPPPFVEDMYRPEHFAIGATQQRLSVRP